MRTITGCRLTYKSFSNEVEKPFIHSTSGLVILLNLVTTVSVPGAPAKSHVALCAMCAHETPPYIPKLGHLEMVN